MSEQDAKDVERQLLVMEELKDCEDNLNLFFDEYEGFNDMETDIDVIYIYNIHRKCYSLTK